MRLLLLLLFVFSASANGQSAIDDALDFASCKGLIIAGDTYSLIALNGGEVNRWDVSFHFIDKAFFTYLKAMSWCEDDKASLEQVNIRIAENKLLQQEIACNYHSTMANEASLRSKVAFEENNDAESSLLYAREALYSVQEAIKRYPNRSYEDVWEGWNDFLGTDNKFDNRKRKYRPLAEALAWSHSLGLTSEKQWLNYVINNRDTMPSDIPSRPDVVYDDWRSWMHWCGSKAKEKVEAQRQVIDESAIFYVIQEKEYAHRNTIFTFGMERGWCIGAERSMESIKEFQLSKNVLL